MVNFEDFKLSNGLRVITHNDPNCHLAVVNILYDVGSKDEDPNKTGLAHLLEHCMFSGSCHIPVYDKPLQSVGGESNAFTTADVTNYYCTLPAVNLETAFWLESDRMLGLTFEKRAFDIQRKVVGEEFKERYLNQPYGDLWHHLTGLAYQVHPYQWPTIGKSLEHIDRIELEDMKDFFYQFYRPNNAILVVAGAIDTSCVEKLCQKWFGNIPTGHIRTRHLPQEPKQKSPRRKYLEGSVPVDRLYRAYHIPKRMSKDYYPTLLMAALLGEGNSSLLYKRLVIEEELYTEIEVSTVDFIDGGLLLISGDLKSNVDFNQAEDALNRALNGLPGVSCQDFKKVKNQMEAQYLFGQVDLTNRAQALAFATLLGDTHLVNSELNTIQQVNWEDLCALFDRTIREENSLTIHYKASCTDLGNTTISSIA